MSYIPYCCFVVNAAAIVIVVKCVIIVQANTVDSQKNPINSSEHKQLVSFILHWPPFWHGPRGEDPALTHI